MGRPLNWICSTTNPISRPCAATDLPESVRMGQRLTGMTAYQTKFPTASSIFRFSQHGQGGAWLSELLPYTGKSPTILHSFGRCTPKPLTTIPQSLSFKRDFSWLEGRASAPGLPTAWVARTQDLPAFVVMVSQGDGNLKHWPTANGEADFCPRNIRA